MKQFIALLAVVCSGLSALDPSYNEYLFVTAAGYGEIRLHLSSPERIPLASVDEVFLSLRSSRPALTVTFFSYSYTHPFHNYFATVSFPTLASLSAISNAYLPFLAQRTFSLTRAEGGGMDMLVTVTPSTNIPAILPKAPVYPSLVDSNARAPYSLPGVPSLYSNIVSMTNTNAVVLTNAGPRSASERMAERIDDIMLGRTNALSNSTPAAAAAIRGSYQLEMNLPAKVKSDSGTVSRTAENVITWDIPYAVTNTLTFGAVTENMVAARRSYRVFKGEKNVLISGPSGAALPSDHFIYTALQQKRPGIFANASFEVRSVTIRKKTFSERYIDCDVEVTASTRGGTLEKWRFEEKVALE